MASVVPSSAAPSTSGSTGLPDAPGALATPPSATPPSLDPSHAPTIARTIEKKEKEHQARTLRRDRGEADLMFGLSIALALPTAPLCFIPGSAEVIKLVGFMGVCGAAALAWIAVYKVIVSWWAASRREKRQSLWLVAWALVTASLLVLVLRTKRGYEGPAETPRWRSGGAGTGALSLLEEETPQRLVWLRPGTNAGLAAPRG